MEKGNNDIFYKYILNTSIEKIDSKNTVAIDTNIIMLLLGYSTNNTIDLDKLKKFLENKDVIIFIASISELIKRVKLSLDFLSDYRKLPNYFKGIYYCLDERIIDDIEEYIDVNIWLNLERTSLEDFLIERIKLMKYYSDVYTLFLSNASINTLQLYTTIIESTLSIDSKEKSKVVIKYLEKILYSIYDIVEEIYSKELKKLIVKDKFTEKDISKLFKCITTNMVFSFCPSYNVIMKEINNDRIYLKDGFFDTCLNALSLWEERIHPIPLNYQGKYSKEQNESLKIFSQVKNISNEVDNYIRNMSFDSRTKSTVLNEFYYENLKQTYNGKFKFSTNNVLDYIIVNNFLNTDSPLFISFDNKLINILSRVNEKRIDSSIRLIKSFYK